MTAAHQASGLLRPPAGAAACWVAVTGGKGGVGKTLLAVQLALAIARAGRRVLLLDADPGLGNVGVQLRLAPPRTLEDVLQGRCTAADAIEHGPGGVDLLAGANGSTALACATRDGLAALHAAVAAAAHRHDVVICDTGAGIGAPVVEAVRRANLTLAVTTPDPAAVTDCYALCKVMRAERLALPRLVVNRVRSRDDALRTATRLRAVCERFLGETAELHGWLRDDRQLELAVHRQEVARLDPALAAAEDLRALAAATLSALPPLRARAFSRGG